MASGRHRASDDGTRCPRETIRICASMQRMNSRSAAFGDRRISASHSSLPAALRGCRGWRDTGLLGGEVPEQIASLTPQAAAMSLVRVPLNPCRENRAMAWLSKWRRGRRQRRCRGAGGRDRGKHRDWRGWCSQVSTHLMYRDASIQSSHSLNRSIPAKVTGDRAIRQTTAQNGECLESKPDAALKTRPSNGAHASLPRPSTPRSGRIADSSVSGERS